MAKKTQPAPDLLETIRKVGDKYCLFEEGTDKRIACHDTLGEAQAQERAIRARKAEEGMKTKYGKLVPCDPGSIHFMERAISVPGKVVVAPQNWQEAGLTKLELHGVKVLGVRSVNRNKDGSHNHYTETARDKAVADGIYETCPVFMDHRDPDSDLERSWGDKLGLLEGVTNRRGEGLFAETLKINPHHAHAKQLAWDAINNPRGVGLSHDAHGGGQRNGADFDVTEIKQVNSTDVVGAGATTRGLFENQRGGTSMATPKTPKAPTPAKFREAFDEPTRAAAAKLTEIAGNPEDPEGAAKVRAVCEELMTAIGAEQAPPQGDQQAADPLVATEADQQEIKALRQDLDAINLREEKRELKEKRGKQLRESGIPSSYVTNQLWKDLLKDDDEEATKRLQERKALAFHRNPRSRDGSQGAAEEKELTVELLEQRLNSAYNGR